MNKDAFLSVPGHLYEAEGYLLQRLMEGKTVLELGTHHGRSAVAMAATAQNVWTIDNYQGDSMIGAPNWEVTRKVVEEQVVNSTEFKAHPRLPIRLMIGDWTEDWKEGRNVVFDSLERGSVDAVFYDAAHAPPHPYEKEFLQMIEDTDFRGLVALHDYKPQELAYKHTVDAIDQYAKRSGRTMFGPEKGTSIVWFEPF